MIYISTGGFKNMTPTESIKYFNKNGINNIELSGGKYEEKIYEKLKKINLIILVFTTIFQHQRKHLL